MGNPGVPLGGNLEMTLELQRRILTRRQLIASGFNDVAIYRNVRRGRWRRVLPGICALEPGGLSTEQRRISAALYAGPGAQLTGLCALHWYGFRHAPTTERIHVLVPHETRRRSTDFVVVQRTHELDAEAREASLYQVTSPARAVIDACRSTSDLRTIRAIMSEAVQRRFTSLRALDDQIRRAGRSRTGLARRVLRELVSGVRSSPEAELRDLALSSTVLPPVLWNARLFGPDGEPLPTPDGWIDEAGIALEVDSREHHSGVDDWALTLRRHNILTQYGALVLHFTPQEIRHEPARVLRVIEQACAGRQAANVQLPVSVGAPS
jgi:hypothetical protein